MAKRRLTKQQRNRISNNQSQQLAKANQQKGLLIARYGRFADVLTEAGNVQHCAIRQNIPDLVVGDEIVWQPEEQQLGVVTALLDRRSELYRTSFHGQRKLIAANLDQVIIVMPTRPDISKFDLDCYIAASELCQLKPIIVINKIDLLTDEQLKALQERFNCYAEIGYALLFVSSENQANLEALSAVLCDNASAFVGPSGAGKSTLIKDFVDDKSIVVGEVSTATDYGKHTTTTSQLYFLNEESIIIDSPGVRSFGLGELTADQVYSGFIEIKPLQGQCKFRNCRHQQEPGCAIKQALLDGGIEESRFNSFIKLFGNAKHG